MNRNSRSPDVQLYSNCSVRQVRNPRPYRCQIRRGGPGFGNPGRAKARFVRRFALKHIVRDYVRIRASEQSVFFHEMTGRIQSGQQIAGPDRTVRRIGPAVDAAGQRHGEGAGRHGSLLLHDHARVDPAGHRAVVARPAMRGWPGCGESMATIMPGSTMLFPPQGQLSPNCAAIVMMSPMSTTLLPLKS